MESPVQSSFIPRDAGTPSRVQSGGRGGLSELFLLISILLLVVSGALAAGVFLYTQYLETSTKSKLDQLNRAEAAFDPSLVQQLTRLDNRMRAGEALLSAHVAPSQLFATLEQTTAQDISFSSLSYDASDPTQISLKMNGVAGSVNSIALQAQLFSQSGLITSPIFSNIDAEQDGIHFSFSGLVNPSAISYGKLVGASAPSPQAQPQTQTQTQAPASPFESSGSGSATQTQ